MKLFVLANKNLLKKFRLTGTNSTMTMLKDVFGDDPDIMFGPVCKSGPLGGDAELVALMCSGDLGGLIFFQDPMSAHPHQSDIEILCRQSLVYNVMLANNPTSALMAMTTLRLSLQENRPDLIPSFFLDLQSPTVGAYQRDQKKVVDSHHQQGEEEDVDKIGDSTSKNHTPTSPSSTSSSEGGSLLCQHSSSIKMSSHHQPTVPTFWSDEDQIQLGGPAANAHYQYVDAYTMEDASIFDDSSVVSNQSSIASRRDSKIRAKNKLIDAINSLVAVSKKSTTRRNAITSGNRTGRSSPEVMSHRRSAKDHLLRNNARDASLSSLVRRSSARSQDKHSLDRLEEIPVLVDRLSRSDHHHDLRYLDRRSNNGRRYHSFRHQGRDLFDLHEHDNDDVSVDVRLSRSDHTYDQRRYQQRKHVERNNKMMGTDLKYSVGGTTGCAGDALVAAPCEAGMPHGRSNRRGQQMAPERRSTSSSGNAQLRMVGDLGKMNTRNGGGIVNHQDGSGKGKSVQNRKASKIGKQDSAYSSHQQFRNY